MCNERNPRRPEARVFVRARDLFAEFRSKFAVYGRAVYADLFKYTAAHEGHHATPARPATVVGAVPWRTGETPRGTVGQWSLVWKRFFECLKGRANIVAQPFKPGSRARLSGFKLSSVHQRFPVAS